MKLKENKSKLADYFTDSIMVIAGEGVREKARQVSQQIAERVVEFFEEQTSISKSSDENKLNQKRNAKQGSIIEVSRKTLSGKPSGEVIVCPSKLSGVEFLTKYNAWAFVNVSEKRKLQYLALYVGKPESSVLYFGEIEKISKPIQSATDIEEFKEDVETFKPGKRIVYLKHNSLVKLTDPILLGNKRKAPRGLIYTSLEKLVIANKVEEL
jgi:hypothetical protein